MSRNDSLRRKLLAATQSMVQGGLSETTRTCGQPSCACHSDPARRHGPHLYLTFRADGKSCSLYVPPEYAAPARGARAAWARFWELGCRIAARNREQLRRRWARTAAPSRRHTTGGRS